MAEPVLSAHEARIMIDGAVAMERFSLAMTGDRAVLAGDAGAILAALTGVPRSAGDLPGEAFVVSGTLLLAGRSVAEGAHVAGMGAAPLDPPLPPGWTVAEYVAWGARLAGARRGAAHDLAAMALSRVGLAPARKKPVEALALPERRALVLAGAMAAGPEVLVAEAPLAGLDGPGAAFVLAALSAAIEGRRSVISVARLAAGTAEGNFGRTASHLAVIAGGAVALEGPAGELFAGARIYAISVRSNAEPLRAELLARGIDLRGGPVRFSAALPAGASSRDILAAAQAARAAVVEMVPVIG